MLVRPVHTSCCDGTTRELELRERRGDCPRLEPGRPDELVSARRAHLEGARDDIRGRGEIDGLRFRTGDAEHFEDVAGARASESAPSRSSSFVPLDKADVISPGTANTSRPSSSARSAVISAPLRSRASTTIVTADSPAMIRLRAGNRHGAGSTRGAYSETAEPDSRMRARQLGMGRRVVAVDPAAEDRDRRACGL